VCMIAITTKKLSANSGLQWKVENLEGLFFFIDKITYTTPFAYLCGEPQFSQLTSFFSFFSFFRSIHNHLLEKLNYIFRLI
jgi:hypothetical protein